MSIIVVLHEPQDLVNIAHVVRAMKNFGFRDLRLVQPREYDGYRVEGIAHQSHDVVSRITLFDSLDAALGQTQQSAPARSGGGNPRARRARPSGGAVRAGRQGIVQRGARSVPPHRDDPVLAVVSVLESRARGRGDAV